MITDIVHPVYFRNAPITSFHSPLRTVRTTAGLTQVALADLVGVSKITIEKVENGRLPISERLAFKLRLKLGCVVREETDDQRRPIFVVEPVAAETRRPYTAKDFKKHAERYRNADPKSELWVGGALEIARLLFLAAVRAGKASQVSGDFEQFVLKALCDGDMDDALLATLRQECPRHGKAGQVRRYAEISPIEAGLEALGLSSNSLLRRPMTTSPEKPKKGFRG